MVSTITIASQRQPKVLGKPEEFMFEAVQKDYFLIYKILQYFHVIFKKS